MSKTTERVGRRLFDVFVRLNRLAYASTGGRIGGRVAGAPVLLLTTTGRRSGRERTTPLLYLEDEGRLVVVASYGGAPSNPAWFVNLRAQPEVEVRLGRERRRLRARVAGSEERAALWPRLVAMYGPYDAYQQRTSREIPVVCLEPEGEPGVPTPSYPAA